MDYQNDVNNDGLADIIAVQPTPLRIHTFTARGDGYFVQGPRYDSDNDPSYGNWIFLTGETEGNGRTDVIAVQPSSMRIDVFKNIIDPEAPQRVPPAPGFEPGLKRYPPDNIVAFEDYSHFLFFVGDVNDNGLADIIAVQPTPLRIHTFTARGDGYFVQGPRYDSDNDPSYGNWVFLTGETEGNGRTDVIAVQPSPMRIDVFKNIIDPEAPQRVPPAPGFEPGLKRYPPDNIVAFEDYSHFLFFVGDVNDNGLADIIAVQPTPLRIHTFTARGDGYFVQGPRYDSDNDPSYGNWIFLTGETEGNGRTDVIAVQPSSMRIDVFKNIIDPEAPQRVPPAPGFEPGLKRYPPDNIVAFEDYSPFQFPTHSRPSFHSLLLSANAVYTVALQQANLNPELAQTTVDLHQQIRTFTAPDILPNDINLFGAVSTKYMELDARYNLGEASREAVWEPGAVADSLLRIAQEYESNDRPEDAQEARDAAAQALQSGDSSVAANVFRDFCAGKNLNPDVEIIDLGVDDDIPIPEPPPDPDNPDPDIGDPDPQD